MTPQQADLALAKTVSDPTPNVGDTITYTITLTDNGPDNATSVQVTDLLPSGVSFVSATPSQGTYRAARGLWNRRHRDHLGAADPRLDGDRRQPERRDEHGDDQRTPTSSTPTRPTTPPAPS